MAAAEPTGFLAINQQLNQTIETLLTALASGVPPNPIVEHARAVVSSSSQALRGLDVQSDPNIDKVVHHVDLVLATLESIALAPDLARKLLAHLLEEQLEITAQAGAGDLQVPGGRPPLTVGSLIGK